MTHLKNNALLQITILSAVFYALYIIVEQRTKPTIVIEDKMITALIESEEVLNQKQLSDSEKASIIEDFILEEVLLHEAYQKELYKNDFSIRKRLLSIMENTVVATVNDPTDAELHAYYLKHLNEYASPNQPKPSFESIKKFIRTDYLAKEQITKRKENIKRLQKKYVIKFED